MPVEYVDFEAARARTGLRMVVVPGVPSPWGEAAKGILHVKRIPYVAVRLAAADAAMAEWAGQRSGPVAIYEDEPPRGGWAEILLLAERLSPTPALIPSDAAQRALMMGIAHEVCGEMGLAWCRRNLGVHAGLTGGVGFPEGVARYLADKYAYRPEEVALYQARVVEVLGLLSARLRDQQQAGSRFYLGDALTALDIYSATFMALFAPLPPDQCPMPEIMRPGFEHLDDATRDALDPALLQHRDFVYESFLELPLSL
jgi:glutathione S-transferase